MVSTKHDYLARCRAGIARYKFFDQAPTTELLREAQVRCGELRLPIPRDEKGDILPYPTTKSKADIFTLEQYKEIDNHALRAPNSLQSAELTDLVKYLLKPAHNDVAKVRVIFRWISGQDLLRYKHIHGAPRDSAAMYLNELKQNKGSYESLFRQMCTYAGIPCEKITGYAKGVSYKVGEDVLENARNTWNAVLVDSNWRLIDMQWASRQVVTQDQGEWELIDDGTGAKPAKSDDSDVSYDIYAYEEFYFLCDPEEFIYSHFPDEEAWQLLARPVSFAEFQKIAYLRSKFFELNLTVISHPWCVLQAISGEANLDLGYRSDTMKFSYNLYRSTKVEHKQIQANYDMDKFLFLDAIPDEKTLSMEIFFPTTGKFKAELFGRDTTESDTVLKWLCTYVFYCETPKTDCRPLPQNPRKEWGPGSDTISMGMEPITHKRGKINVDDGEVEVKFALKEDRDFLHKLTTEDNKTLDNYTVHRIENGEVIFNARVPGKGQYMLSIMAKEDDQDGSYPNVCNYLLRCEEEFPPLEPFPEIPNGELGPTDEFKKLQLELLDGCQSMITVDKSGQTLFKMKIPKGVEFFAKLGLQTPSGVEDKSEFVSWYRDGDVVTFDLRFAQKGSYRFNLFAKPAGQPGGFPRAFSSIIEVPIPMMVAMSFPEKYAGWTDECKLIEPFNKDIAAKENIEFAAVVPKAKAVAVVGDEWTQLKKDNDGIWRNSVYTIEEGKPMFLSAKFDAEGNSFSHLLKYNVVPKSKIEEMAREQSRAHHEADKEYQERQRMKEELKKKGEEKRKQEAVDKKRRMELQVMEDGERKQIEERFDFEDSGQGDTATAKRLEEERKQREEDRKKKVEAIKQRDEELIKKREYPRSASSDSWKSRGPQKIDLLREQLREAMKQKSKTKLEKVIRDCEVAEIPELGLELSKARDMLETISGSRGGTKCSDDLRHKLQTAMKSKNKNELEKAIDECQASGFRELMQDVEKANAILVSVGGKRRGAKSPEVLRDQLKDALRHRNKKELEQAIQEAEASNYPELQSDIIKAKQMLKSADLDRPGSKSPDDLRKELKTALRSKSRDSLEKIITECEQYSYPELGSELREARDTLESLGGGRGGTKTAENLREKLTRALQSGDKDTLERVIDECVAAGMPELDTEIDRARDALEDMDDFVGQRRRDFRFASPDTLRDQLQEAIRTKDTDALARIIDEAENAGYPELGTDLRAARSTLESLGGGRGGSKTPEMLREKLQDASRRQDKESLDRALRECVAAGFPELDADIQQARRLSNILGGGTGDIKNADDIHDQLSIAIKSKDVDALSKAIQEAEEAGYPELGTELRKARDSLEALGGGRGGSKSPDVLRDRLRAAMRDGTKDDLESIISECVAAGMPELDSAIHQARNLLDDFDNYQSRGLRSVSPDSLRDQLQQAIKTKDRNALEELIDEAERAGYPELGSELREARETLENLGGGTGGTKSPDVLRKKLEDAMRRKDKRALDKAIRECVAAGMPSLDDAIQKARTVSDILGGGAGDIKSSETLRKHLADAINSKDINKLQKAIQEAEDAGYPELGAQLRKARDTLEALGGGRGGSKTPEVMKERLRSAIRKGDKDELESALDEAVAAGMPELDADIYRARKSLDDQDTGSRRSSRRESKTPDILRDQLRRASRLRDKAALEKLIDEAEQAGYPEIGTELSKARDTLESLGGGRGGSKTPDILRQKLEDAMKQKDKDQLDKVIRECVAAGMPELRDHVQQARRVSDILGGGTGEVKSPDAISDQLKKAVRRKDIASLQKAIADAEEAGYPEVATELRKARDTLENLGGGRGGSKTPEVLREKLRTAIRDGSKDDLEKVIDECIAAAMPELDIEIQRARESLDATENGHRRESLSPDTLRDQLRRASRQGDKAELEKLIDEAEDAGYPELGYDLRKARESLESLGGGRGGSKSPEVLREKLQDAARRKDKRSLDKVISECLAAGFPELDDDIQKARRTSDIMKGGKGEVKSPDTLRDQIKMAMRNKDKDALDAAIAEAEAAGYPELGSDLRKARDTLENLGGGRGGTKSASSLRAKLRDAIRRGHPDAIESVIGECVASGMPELDADVQRARGILEGRQDDFGVDKSSDVLRDQLKTAIKQNDKAGLQRAIEEAEAAGLPELGYDLRKARDALDKLGGGRGGSMSPDNLRDKLKRAMKLKDRQALEKAIEECVASGHPELLADVQQARDVLDSIGGGRRASKPADVLRDQLKAAMKSKHPASLERAIAEAEASKDPQLIAEIQSAKKMLDAVWPARAGSPEEVRKLRAKLESAMRRDDTAEMQRIMIEIEQKNLSDYLTVEVGDARSRLQGQQGHIQPDPEGHLTRTEASIDARGAARFGQYSQYGTLSHDLLIAALVVIGENERQLGNWKNFQHFFDVAQADGSSRRVLGMDIEHIYQDLSARADDILNRHSTDEVHLLNRSGHMSYSWSRFLNQQMSAHFNSFSSSTGGGTQSGRSSSSSSFAESTAQMSQTSRTEFQTFGGSRVTSYTSEGPTTTTYQYSQGSRRDGQNGNTGFTSYSTTSKRRF